MSGPERDRRTGRCRPRAGCDDGRVTPDEPLLVDQNPLPAALSKRLTEQLSFLIEVDRMKTVLRASPLAATERRENDAEHSWHLALMVMLLSDYADERIDIGHTIRLVGIH